MTDDERLLHAGMTRASDIRWRVEYLNAGDLAELDAFKASEGWRACVSFDDSDFYVSSATCASALEAVQAVLEKALACGDLLPSDIPPVERLLGDLRATAPRPE